MTDPPAPFDGGEMLTIAAALLSPILAWAFAAWVFVAAVRRRSSGPAFVRWLMLVVGLVFFGLAASVLAANTIWTAATTP